MRIAKPATHDWVNGVTPDDVRKMIERTFAFLVSDHSFQEPVDCSINTIAIALSYAGKYLAIEPCVDRKDRFVETLIVRLKNSTRPDGWEIDKEGQQFMQRLFVAAWDRGVKRTETKHSSNSPEQELQSLLDAEVAMLRQSFPDFLADDDSYFEELNHRRSAKAAIKAEKDFFAVAEELFKTKNFAGLTAHLSSTSYTLSKLWQARFAYARKKA